MSKNGGADGLGPKGAAGSFPATGINHSRDEYRAARRGCQAGGLNIKSKGGHPASAGRSMTGLNFLFMGQGPVFWSDLPVRRAKADC